MSNTAIIDFREAQKSAEELVKQLGNVAKEASSIISLLQRANKDGWVVTRSVAEWATGEWAASKAKKKSTAPKYTPIV